MIVGWDNDCNLNFEDFGVTLRSVSVVMRPMVSRSRGAGLVWLAVSTDDSWIIVDCWWLIVDCWLLVVFFGCGDCVFSCQRLAPQTTKTYVCSFCVVARMFQKDGSWACIWLDTKKRFFSIWLKMWEREDATPTINAHWICLVSHWFRIECFFELIL